MLKTLVENMDKQNLKSLFQIEEVFDSDQCMICLCADPDSVIMQCGHQCLHFDCNDNNLVRCPLCRKMIGGLVKLKVQVQTGN